MRRWGGASAAGAIKYRRDTVVPCQDAKERTALEFHSLLTAAGLKLVKERDLPVAASLIEAAGFSLLEGVPT